MVFHNKPEVILYRYTFSLASDFPNRGEERKMRERMMSICFIGLLIGCFSRTQYIINRFVLQVCGDFTWRVSDCEEIVGQLPSLSLIPQFSTTIYQSGSRIALERDFRIGFVKYVINLLLPTFKSAEASIPGVKSKSSGKPIISASSTLTRPR